MAKAKEHYDSHLGNFYSWMMGDLDANKNKFVSFLRSNNITPLLSKKAIDCGTGNGIQSLALAEIGFDVFSIDFCDKLLQELKNSSQGYKIEIINGDIRKITDYVSFEPELITCCGDTLTHLESKDEIYKFIADAADLLIPNGNLIISFRDYSKELRGVNRIIPVKNDGTKILTCILDYEDEYVNVTDLLYEQEANEWKYKISSYKKARILKEEVINAIESVGLKIALNESNNGMITIMARK